MRLTEAGQREHSEERHEIKTMALLAGRLDAVREAALADSAALPVHGALLSCRGHRLLVHAAAVTNRRDPTWEHTVE